MPTKRFALIGSPIQHSWSPFIHNAAFEILGLDATYESVWVDERLLKEKWHELRQTYLGLNVTIPLKQSVVTLLDERSAEVLAIGAANTITFTNRMSRGFNTDWLGFIDALEGTSIAGGDVILLGAGGAARAVLYAMIHALWPANIWIVNRSVERARALVAEAAVWQPSSKLHIRTDVDGLEGEFCLAVQATSVGSDGISCPLPERFFEKIRIAFDLVYRETLFLEYARRRGCRTIHGMEMLLAQAARAFEIFTDRSFPNQEVRLRLQKELK